ncbi:MAG: hypothetical protein NUV65_03905 [Candidatus Roizmanbacteria bacterium]|nr:hypothetical protein [Candidatus Roizmanbacteria bacterium]
MFSNLSTNKILWSITTGLTFIAASIGIAAPHIYDGVFAKEFIPGALPQDVLTMILCIFLFYLIIKTKENSLKTQIFIFGIMGSFFYLYGIFTIERVYNFLYILYCAIFASSFWSILYSLMRVKSDFLGKLKYSNKLVTLSAVIGILIASLFTFLWISALIPLMRDRNRIEYLYSIYLLDLCFVMPAFFITSILSLRKNIVGILFLPAVFIVGFFVIFPLGLGEIAKPFYGQTINVGSMIMSFLFSFLMIVVGIGHLNNIHIKDTSS